MTRCYRHGIDHSGYECPRCEAEQRAEEANRRASERHEESLRHAERLAEEARYEEDRIAQLHADAVRDVAYRTANPGDYQCPHCRFDTLRKNASRCPRCQGTVDKSYWDKVRRYEELEQVSLRAREARERKEKALREEQQARLAQQMAKEHAAKLAAAQAAERAAARRKRKSFILTVGFALLSFASSIALAQFADVGLQRLLWYLLVPVFGFMCYYFNDSPDLHNLPLALTVTVVVSLLAPLIVFFRPLSMILESYAVAQSGLGGHGGVLASVAAIILILGALNSRYLESALLAIGFLLLAAAAG